MTTPPTHEQERQAILKEYPLTYFIAAAALFIVVGIGIGAVLFGQNTPLADQDNNYFSNVYLTIISTAFTVIVIDRLNRRRDDQRDLRQLQEQLVRDAGSLSNEIVKNAIHQLRSRKWLTGETALLQSANLRKANMQGAYLRRANLQEANLFMAVMVGANLLGANLQDADLVRVNFQDADLRETNLNDAVLDGVNLQGADLQLAILNESTTLPDNTLWTPDTDITRFTDPNHPNFWRSDETWSPAYRGDGAAPTSSPKP